MHPAVRGGTTVYCIQLAAASISLRHTELGRASARFGYGERQLDRLAVHGMQAAAQLPGYDTASTAQGFNDCTEG